LAATYPANIRTFTARRDFLDTVLADDVDSLQDEITAIETILGRSPHIGTSPNVATGFTSGTTFSNLVARLANIENGIVGDTHAQYLLKTGGTINGNLTVTGTITGTVASTGSIISTAFHFAGALTTGIKIPKYVVPVNMKILTANTIVDSGAAGSTVTYQLVVNGTNVGNPVQIGLGAPAQTYAPNTGAGIAVSARDRVAINITAITGSPSDLSLSLGLITT
jgi:hypothetical protein